MFGDSRQKARNLEFRSIEFVSKLLSSGLISFPSDIL